MITTGPSTSSQPAYLTLSASAIAERAQHAVAMLEDCRVCPRDCGVNRLVDKWSACKTGRFAVVSSVFPHFGEEDCLRGWNGSGTIFFAHCNLRCVFCQNYDISQAIRPGANRGSSPEQLAQAMMALQARGCHNINLVTPEHVVPQVLESLELAIDLGLRLPIVYNTSAYDSLESLELMDGVVDIYMPDFKYWSSDLAATYLKAGDYPDVARATIREMHRQVGVLTFDEHGLARRGVLIRHLMMPGQLDDTREILEWIAAELGSNSYVNLMDQYRPAGRVGGGRYAEIDRSLSRLDFGAARAIAEDLGLRLDQRRTPPATRPRSVAAPRSRL